MADKLPLDSPLWDRLSACSSSSNAVARLREIVAARQLGEAWQDLCDEIMHQGSVYGVSSAVIPHLVEVAPYLPAASKRDVWIEIGFLVTSGADRFPSPPAEGLQEGLSAALRTAEALALRDFLADRELPAGDSSYYALACVALAGHSVGRALWKFPSAGSGYIELVCPGCGTEYELDGFADPLAPPCPAPVFDPVTGTATAWQGIAAAIERCGRDQVLGPGWDDFFDTARQAAAAGVPAQAPPGAVWCLVAAMVGASSDTAAPWARTLARLAGHFRCLDCDKVWAIADALDDRPGAPADVTGDVGAPDSAEQGVLFEADAGLAGKRRLRGIPAATVADGIAGFRPAPGHEFRRAQVAVRPLWHADGGSVSALTRITGQPGVVAAAGHDGIRLHDAVSGSLAGPPIAGPATAVASLALPDGGDVIAAAGEDGRLRWWDAASGRSLGSPGALGSLGSLGAAAEGPESVRSLAVVRMPASPNPHTATHLAGLWDGRALLAAGDADGRIRLWDPAARAPVHELSWRAGQPVASMTAAGPGSSSPGNGTVLIAVHNGLVVDVWNSAAVHGRHAEITSAPRLGAIGHRRIAGAVAFPEVAGFRKPVLLADHDGTVSMWETFGVRLGDPLPPDPAHREVAGIAVLTAGDGIAVITASRADRNLRVWEPLRGAAALIPLGVRPRCLLSTGDALVIGHDDGLLALSLTVNGARP